jgi:hypothetical protein
MASIINGSSPTLTFSDGTTQATSAIVSGYVPYANLPAGSVLQVVNATYSTTVASISSTFADTGLSASITPKFSTSKVLVEVVVNGCRKYNSDTVLQLQLLRSATRITGIDGFIGFTSSTSNNAVGSSCASYLDSPSTTSATTYKVQFASGANSIGVKINEYNNTTGETVSFITLTEIAG